MILSLLLKTFNILKVGEFVPRWDNLYSSTKYPTTKTGHKQVLSLFDLLNFLFTEKMITKIGLTQD